MVGPGTAVRVTVLVVFALEEGLALNLILSDFYSVQKSSDISKLVRALTERLIGLDREVIALRLIKNQ